jgi:enoyl-CoA hydratase
MSVKIERSGRVTTVVLTRPERRNAIDGATASALASAMRAFDADPDADVAVLWGEGGHFCGGADLKAFAEDPAQMRLSADGDAPLGISRLQLTKPVIAAVSGYAVAGGLELACWCDLRIAEESAVFGVFCRRFGVPLIDGGTIRLPRLIGHSRAALILTADAPSADEALAIGLVNRVVPDGESRRPEALAALIAFSGSACATIDCPKRWMPSRDAQRNAHGLGIAPVAKHAQVPNASQGEGKHGTSDDPAG